MDRTSPVILGDHVTLEAGTGLVQVSGFSMSHLLDEGEIFHDLGLNV